MAVSSSSSAASDHNNSQVETKQQPTNPGERVITGNLYESDKRKTCHQCRHKPRSGAAACKNQRNNKPCTMLFCHQCLLNRYGEKAEEVEVLEKWSCPRCRGICNCSCCMKKRGQLPTGILSHKVKAAGYSSVSELLHVNGPEVKNEKDTGAPLKKRGASEKEIALPRKKGKENLYDGRVDINMESVTPVSLSRNFKLKGLEKMQDETLEIDGLSKCSPDRKLKKIKQEASKMLYAGQKDASALEGRGLLLNERVKEDISQEELKNLHDGGTTSGALLESSPKEPRVSNVSSHNEVNSNGKIDDGLTVEDGCLAKFSIEVPVAPFKNIKGNENTDIKEPYNKRNRKGVKHDTCVQRRDGADVPLPLGMELTTIADVELPLKDAGNALQFLEFCAAFGKALNMKKGQSSIILQELINGQSRTLRRSAQRSAVVRFHMQLLSLLQKESGSRPQNLSSSRGKYSWLLALKNCISQSANTVDSLPIDCLDSEAGGYDTLDSSTKLRILIFLCDEVLETLTIREWINDQELKFAEKVKQAKKRVLAVKDKYKSLKQKVMNELANANIAKDEASLSTSEHDEIVRQIKSEATQAHKEMLQSMKMVPKTKERAKAVRTQPIFLDVDGCAFWRLNGYSDVSSILVQDIGNGDDSVALGEKWVAFDNEQEKVVEKHISFRRGRRVRTRPVAEIITSQNDA